MKRPAEVIAMLAILGAAAAVATVQAQTSIAANPFASPFSGPVALSSPATRTGIGR